MGFFTKINVWGLVRGHVYTLKHADAQKPPVSELLVFFGLPVIAATLLIVADVKLKAVSELLTAMSVFAALLFNLLILMFDVATGGKEQQPGDEGPSRQRVLAEVHENVSFAVLVSIMSVLVLSTAAIFGQKAAHPVLAWLTYMLLGVFILTLLMTLKRVHIVLGKEIDPR